VLESLEARDLLSLTAELPSVPLDHADRTEGPEAETVIAEHLAVQHTPDVTTDETTHDAAPAAPPVIDFFALPSAITTNLGSFLVAGVADPNNLVELNVNGESYPTGQIGELGEFAIKVGLAEGQNSLEVVVKSDLGEQLASASKSVVFDPGFSTSEKPLLYVDTEAQGAGGTVVLDIAADAVLGVIEGHVRGISPDGRVLYMSDKSTVSTAYHRQLGTLPFSDDIPEIPPDGLLVSPTANRLYCRTEQVGVEGETYERLEDLPADITTSWNGGGAAITPDGSTIYAGHDILRIHPLEDEANSPVAQHTPITQDGHHVSDLALSPDGRFLLVAKFGWSEGHLDVYNVDTLSLAASFSGLADYTGAIGFLSDKIAVVGSAGNPWRGDGRITLIDLDKLQIISQVSMPLADNLDTSDERNEIYVSAGEFEGHRLGVEVWVMEDEGLHRTKTLFLGINRFHDHSGQDQIKGIVFKPAQTPHPPVPELMEVRLEATDPDGVPISKVSLGDSFLVSAFVQDLRPNAQGVFAAYLDVTYDSQVASPVGSIRYGDAFPNVREGETSQPDIVDEVGAVGHLDPLGGGEFLLFQTEFAADAVGIAGFVSDPADILPEHDSLLSGLSVPLLPSQIVFGSMSIEVLEPLVLSDDSAAADEDSAIEIDALANDGAAGALTVLSFDSTATHGTVTHVGAGVFRYDPTTASQLQTLRSGETSVDTFTYTARHDDGRTASAAVSISVGGVNDTPTVAHPIPDQELMPTIEFNFAFPRDAFEDMEGDTLTYSATLASGAQIPEWLTFSPEARKLQGTPLLADAGSYTIVVAATDDGEPQESVTDTFVIDVRNPYQNALNPLDVNSDGGVSPLDALVVIAELNDNGARHLLPPEPLLDLPPYYDTSGDMFLTPIDILVVLNFLNLGSGAEGEASHAVVGSGAGDDLFVGQTKSVIGDPAVDIPSFGPLDWLSEPIGLMRFRSPPMEGDHTLPTPTEQPARTLHAAATPANAVRRFASVQNGPTTHRIRFDDLTDRQLDDVLQDVADDVEPIWESEQDVWKKD